MFVSTSCRRIAALVLLLSGRVVVVARAGGRRTGKDKQPDRVKISNLRFACDSLPGTRR
jgi:hypothetical protein